MQSPETYIIPIRAQAELERLVRLILKVQNDVAPQFLIFAPSGNYRLAMVLPEDPGDRAVRVRHLALYLSYKQAFGLTFASRVTEPDAAYCVSVGRVHRSACFARIRNKHGKLGQDDFTPVQWVPAERIDPLLSELLPRWTTPITARDAKILDEWFGPKGKFPAMHYPPCARGPSPPVPSHSWI